MDKTSKKPDTESKPSHRGERVRLSRGNRVLAEVLLGEKPLIIGNSPEAKIRLRKEGLPPEMIILDPTERPVRFESRIPGDRLVLNGWAVTKGDFRVGDKVEFLGLTLELVGPTVAVGSDAPANTPDDSVPSFKEDSVDYNESTPLDIKVDPWIAKTRKSTHIDRRKHVTVGASKAGESALEISDAKALGDHSLSMDRTQDSVASLPELGDEPTDPSGNIVQRSQEEGGANKGEAGELDVGPLGEEISTEVDLDDLELDAPTIDDSAASPAVSEAGGHQPGVTTSNDQDSLSQPDLGGFSGELDRPSAAYIARYPGRPDPKPVGLIIAVVGALLIAAYVGYKVLPSKDPTLVAQANSGGKVKARVGSVPARKNPAKSSDSVDSPHSGSDPPLEKTGWRRKAKEVEEDDELDFEGAENFEEYDELIESADRDESSETGSDEGNRRKDTQIEKGELRAARELEPEQLATIKVASEGTTVRKYRPEIWDSFKYDSFSDGNRREMEAGAEQINTRRVNALVRSKYSGIRRCLSRHGGMKGKKARVVVGFTILLDGRPSDVNVPSSDVKSIPFKQCVIKLIRNIRFPKPKDQSVVVVYPMVFSRN